MEVLEELLATEVIAGADGGAERASARVAAQVGFWEEKQVNALVSSFTGGVCER